ncbi:hypothetical protein GCM10018793_28430 [Streptomyces sulfonofaciens]|uniref:Uncharacterized protein n=1 Tax=Streptomyces sulfonofaciens TaxID=68272 RepID=A0A919G5H6_9ACTN|nr:hypothetical protein GCM10018793_28430 [Streptomyces sulfonofaciens]
MREGHGVQEGRGVRKGARSGPDGCTCEGDFRRAAAHGRGGPGTGLQGRDLGTWGGGWRGSEGETKGTRKEVG